MALRGYYFRHTFATIFLKNSGDLYIASAILGHSDIRTTVSIYGHLRREFRQQVTGKISLEYFIIRDNIK